MAVVHLDALIVGGGFGGIYQTYKLKELGLSFKLIDVAGGPGGTWYWNTYPGCMSDTESFLYRYTFDKELLQSYPWPNRYVSQAEILAYLNHVVDKHDLRKYMHFNIEMLAADFDGEAGTWRVKLSDGKTVVVRYLITCLGLLSKPLYPTIPGIDQFKGELAHTAAWNSDIDVKGKRVGVLGCGSTGVQLINAIAPQVKSLSCFIRHPQYSVPSGQGPITPERRKYINDHYYEIVEQAMNSAVGFGFEEPAVPTMSVSPEEREEIFEKLWRNGNGFNFMFGGFGDISTNEEANEEACRFIRKKIKDIVKDPKKAAILTPTDFYARRPLCDTGFYYQFNSDHVHAIDVEDNPITRITATGVQTADGEEHELDMIAFATGFDAITGNYTRLLIKGRNGESVKDHWSHGPTSYLGMTLPGFPNLFMINGPQGPFANNPPICETEADFIAGAIAHTEKKRKENSKAVFEATYEGELKWGSLCDELSKDSLFRRMKTWVTGGNVEGKPYSCTFYFGGLGSFRKYIAEVIADDYRGFKT